MLCQAFTAVFLASIVLLSSVAGQQVAYQGMPGRSLPIATLSADELHPLSPAAIRQDSFEITAHHLLDMLQRQLRAPEALLLYSAGRTAYASGYTDSSVATASLPLVLSWPATSVIVNFQNSDEVTATFQLYTGGTYSTGNPDIQNRFRFSIDGNTTEQIVRATGSWSASGLSSGAHALTITKLTEALYGVAVLESVQLSSSGRCVHTALALN